MEAAVQAGDLDALNRLIDQDIKDNPPDPQYSIKYTDAMQRACEEASRSNQSAALNLLLDKGCQITSEVYYAASYNKSLDAIDTFLAHGWNINEEIGHALTGSPLFWATSNNDPGMVKFLLSRGASPNASGLRGTPLEKAAASSSIPIISALLDAGGKLEGSAAFSNAAARGRIDALSFLLDRDADINEVPDPDLMLNQTDFDEVKNGLCAAAAHGNDDVVRFLLERGADVSVKDGKGMTALEIARMNGHESCVALLSSNVESVPGV